MAEMIFYRNIVPLDRERHRDLRVTPDHARAPQARETHYLPVGGAEFFAAARDYPIVFSGEGESLAPVVLLGLREGENRFVDGYGQWRDGVHIPAFVRRYPFILAETTGGEGFTIALDEHSELLSETEGERLFDEQGEYSPILQGYIEVMRSFYQDMQRTRALVQCLVDLDLLVERAAGVTGADGERYRLGGLKFVDERKLSELGDKALLALQRDGYLARIHAHLVSVGNLERLALRTAGS